MSLAPGTTLGAYRIVEEIGRGGMAVVYKAYQAGLQRDVAIKVLPDFLAEDESLKQRFQQEALAVARLRHPNILAIYDYHADHGAAYLVMEYIDGGTLADRVGKPHEPAAVVALLSPIASALDYAHARGVLHRDVKPSNILLSSDGFPFLADFGIAKLMESSERMTRTGTLIGTPEYMAPEQATGAPPGPSSDCYALAVVAYELLTGVVPFQGDTPVAILTAHMDRPLPPPCSRNPALPPSVDMALQKALAKHPGDRYPTASAFMAALAAVSQPPPRPLIDPAPILRPTSVPSSPATAGVPAACDQTAAVASTAVASSGPATALAPALTVPPLGKTAGMPAADADQSGLPNDAGDPVSADAVSIVDGGTLRFDHPSTTDGGTLRFDHVPPHTGPAAPAGDSAALATSHAETPAGAAPPASDSDPDDRTMLAAAFVAAAASADDPPDATRLASAELAEATRVVRPADGLTRVAQPPPAEATRMAAPRMAAAPAAPSVAPPPRIGRGWRPAALAIAAALVIAAVGGAALAFRRPAAPHPPTAATTAPAATLARMASAQTTLASAAPTTATPSARSAAPTAIAATATSLPPLTVAPGATLLSDPLTAAATGVLPKQSDQPGAYTVGYTADGYAVHTVDPKQAPPIIPAPGEYANVALTIQARLVGDAANRFIAVGCRRNGQSFYRLLVAVGTGQYLVDEANHGTLQTLADWRASDAIHTGEATNTFALRCAGTTITASANGRQLAVVQDASLRSGQVWIGVGAFPGYAVSTEARFINLNVTQQ